MMSLIILVILIVIYSFDISLSGWLSLIFTAFCFYSVYYELIKATSVHTDWQFIEDLLLSLVALSGISALFAFIFMKGEPFYLETLLGGGVIIFDAISSPIISFKMAHGNVIVANK